jgi:hypothetical protein
MKLERAMLHLEVFLSCMRLVIDLITKEFFMYATNKFIHGHVFIIYC